MREAILTARNSPTIRPANQRYPQPVFNFPSTPPSTAGLDTVLSQPYSIENREGSILTPLSSPLPATRPHKTYFESAESTPRLRHKRALSHSTIDENHVSVRDSDAGAFKVVIERPGAQTKPFDVNSSNPTLDVSIPSYKLGTPRFSIRGTAFMRNSSHTVTEDFRSSVFSGQSTPHNSRRPTRILSRRHSDASYQPPVPALPSPNPYDLASLPSPRIIKKRVTVTPEMFDALTFKPSCDHPSVVRYSGSGAIRAATPARLVAEITSPTFVDYDLLSDFFLTFRTFLDTSDLLSMLLARLKWALARDDEAGTIVRVRTFVAIRHWILNYFLDDFVIDYELRVSFCDSLNNFVSDSPQVANRTKIPLKILGELKKCWRRVCALYWDGPEFDTELGADVQILPGGIGGSRNAKLDPTFWQDREDEPPRLDGIIEPDFVDVDITANAKTHNGYFADVSRAGHLASTLGSTQRQQHREADIGEPPLSPTSVMSEEVVSCSFPLRGRNFDSSRPLGAHPVESSSVYESIPAVSSTPKALTGKRVRPTHSHKRSGSFSDSFRDHRQQPVQKAIYKSTEILLALPYAGSLVRGNMFPPGQAFVDVAPSTPSEVHRATTLFPGLSATQKGPSAMSGPGMKRLMGSVRRVLSAKNTPQAESSPTQGSFPHIPPLGVRGATINRLPGTAVVPQASHRTMNGRPTIRIDILGAEIAEDFKRAVQEDADAEENAEQRADHASSHSSSHAPHTHYSVMAPEVTTEPLSPAPDRRHFMSGVTSGSKSIVIVDDTLPADLPAMRGALAASGSGDTLAGAFVPPSGDPTPPSTPPEASMGVPRRSSHLLGQITKQRTRSHDETPWSMADSKPSGEFERSSSHNLRSKASIHPRVTSHRVKKSTSLRRYASYHSGFTHHKSELSFDASSFSEGVELDQSFQDSTLPQPLRVLRRKPGGDLRAFNNAEDTNSHQLRRPMSTGSLATFTDSVRSSCLLRDSASYVTVEKKDLEQTVPQTFSLGALAEISPKRPVSLFSTHSSQPVMRPSFEKEARFLAQIPDDVDDDGGVESALLKLEGKFEKRQSDPSKTFDSSGGFIGHNNSFGVAPHEMSTLTLEDDNEEEDTRKRRHEYAVELTTTKAIPTAVAYKPQPSQQLEGLKPTVYQPRGMKPSQPQRPHDSIESYNSIPLLQRDLTDDEPENEPQDWTERSILREPSKERGAHDIPTPDSSHPNSFNFIDESESMKDTIIKHMEPDNPSINQSFLDDESCMSDLSSEMSLEVISREEYIEHDFASPDALPGLGISTVVKELAVPLHPPQQPSSPTNPVSQIINNSPRQLFHSQFKGLHASDSKFPPSPETTPTGLLPFDRLHTMNRVASPTFDPLRSHEVHEPSRKTSEHLPFILAFDSQVLAQQFTLIEKDALNEIDWKDLIEMRWKDRGNTESRSWVEFLRTSEPHGVEVVIARFNIMVKWAVSECVLTHDLNERVRCIIKFIHIAAQCRKYRNFATMTQLTVALTSKDITRLTNTWAHVPDAELRTLRDLETLISPTSNFHSLRAEMEGSGAEQGCIPFVGIYTHDLLINQERPSQIASTPTTEPLTNFERCRTDASIVKNLLRLLEASLLYRFLPIEGVTERCLWMAALSDNEIAKYGLMIQES